MKFPLLRFSGIVTGSEIFRVASLYLYITLLLQVILAAHVRHLMLSNLSIIAVTLLIILFFAALARHTWPDAVVSDTRTLVTELSAVIFVIISLTLQQAMPTIPLPWMIGLAGVFPLALDRRLGLVVTLAIALIGFGINLNQGMQIVDWMPHIFATLFVGLSAIFLANALNSNLNALQQAKRNERRFDAIARATRHAFLIADAQFKIKFANPALQDMLGYTYEEIIKNNIPLAVHPDDISAHQEKLRYLRTHPKSAIFSRHRKKHKQGHWVWLETRGYNMLHDNAINGLVFSIEDVTARKDAELKLEEEHALLRAVLDMNPSMIYAKDTKGRFTISNLSFQRRFGYSSEEELRGKTMHDLFLAQATQGQEQAAYDIAEQHHLQDLQVIQTGEPLQDLEVQGLWDNDLRSWYRINKYPLFDSQGHIVGVLGITRDITDRKEYEIRLEHQALHDPLTGLPNRRYVLKAIADSIAQAQETSKQLAMLFCDLDFFKSVNDTHGHDFGDKCLLEITRRISEQLPQDFVARFGGNEFVILSEVPLADAKAKADAILQAVSKQLVVDDIIVKIQASIGIALLAPQHKNPSELIRDADAAMYQAKEKGRNRAEVFDASLQSHRTKRAQMDIALRFALERDELTLVYQPKVSMLNGAVIGFELLLRWHTPQYGSIPPVEFIPIAENSGLVVPIGLWVLEQACKQLRQWQREFGYLSNFTIAVNVSMRQLLQASFLREVTEILERTGVSPHFIELELTETSAMANPLETIENLSRLKKLGLRLALDDFGTGYSSLAYLQKLPIDVLKIDKAFIQGVSKNASDAEIVRLILALAHTLNLDTIAEGVESRDDMIELKKMGCYLAQGFAFSPAVTSEMAGKLLGNSQHFLVA